MDEQLVNDIDLGKFDTTLIDNTRFKEVLEEVANVDGFRDYLRETLALDIKRYFFATKEQQELIKGAYSRTYYLYTTLAKVSEAKIKSLTNK
jgi:hypothetical protein